MSRIIILSLLLWLPFGGAIQASEVDADVVANFGQVQSLCNSSLTYDLNETFDVVSPRYHDQMQCLFGTATAGYLNESQQNFMEKLRSLRSDFELPTVSEDSLSCETDFESIKSAQAEVGYVSLCETSGENAAKDNSLCRVSEAAFNEFCAYQEYVYFKTRDAILTEQCAQGVALFSEITACQNRERSKLQTDLTLARQVLESSLTQYETLTEAWSLHGWFIVLTEGLENTYRRLDLARIALAKWPIKFHDASSQRAGSQTAQ